MKIKECFILKSIAGINTVISVNDESDFTGMLTLNESGVFIWNLLVKGATREEVITALSNEYEIDRAIAEADTDDFLRTLNSIDVFE